MPFIDCHAHVFSENSLPYEQQKSHWQPAQVTRIVHVYCLETDIPLARKHLSDDKHDCLLYCAGVTPHGAKDFTPAAAELLREYRDQIVAVGEIGLDFHYNISPPDVQIEVFHRQLQIAAEIAKPVMLHLRSADREAREILEQYADSLPGIMFHCYTSGAELADWAIAQGFYLSASGIVTFKKSNELREIFRRVPLPQLLVETDAPYLAPHPYRGKTNHPALVVETYRYLAEMYGVSVEQLAQTVWENSSRLFALDSETCP